MDSPGLSLLAHPLEETRNPPLVVSGFGDNQEQVRQSLAPALCRRWLDRFGALTMVP